MINDRTITIFIVALFAVGIGSIGYVFYKRMIDTRNIKEAGLPHCIEETIGAQHKDSFMAGLIEKNQPIKVMKGFYKCNPFRLGDIVFLEFSKNITPVARIVRGLPGDKFSLVKTTDNPKRWWLKINGKEVVSGDQKFWVKNNLVPPLKNLEVAGMNTIPEGKILLLSNVPPGLSDSSNLGLLDQKQILGKVVTKK